MSKENNKLILGIIIGLVIVTLIFLIYNLFQKNSQTEEIEFNIISVSWLDTPKMKDAFAFEGEYNWKDVCNMEENFVSKSWSITTQQNKNIDCYPIINGEKIDIAFDFDEGADTIQDRYSLFYKQNNQITLCCSYFGFEKSNEICDTITLPAKC